MTREIEELRQQTEVELKAIVLEERRKLYDMVNEMRMTKKLEKTHRIRQTKKKLARVLTLLREKEIA